jgi:plastocyanin
VTGAIEVTGDHSQRKTAGSANVAVWLVPLSETGSTRRLNPSPPNRKFTLLQKNKTFEPHLLVIPVGSEVDFPNRDPIFHNVFSLFEGKRFDLGLYESGSSRSLRFDKPGVSYLFCNIHSEMSAIIIALETPYYSITDSTGQVTIRGVPPGHYMLHVWREGSSINALKSLSRSITVSEESVSFGKLLVPNNDPLPLTHKNKYGRDYDDTPSPGHVYKDNSGVPRQ